MAFLLCPHPLSKGALRVQAGGKRPRRPDLCAQQQPSKTIRVNDTGKD